jgi:hypothetical protein
VLTQNLVAIARDSGRVVMLLEKPTNSIGNLASYLIALRDGHGRATGRRHRLCDSDRPQMEPITMRNLRTLT